jgi:hypothetical protein
LPPILGALGNSTAGTILVKLEELEDPLVSIILTVAKANAVKMTKKYIRNDSPQNEYWEKLWYSGA